MKSKEQRELDKALHNLKVSLLDASFVKNIVFTYAIMLGTILVLWLGGGLR